MGKNSTSHNRLGSRKEIIVALVFLALVGLWACAGAPGVS